MLYDCHSFSMKKHTKDNITKEMYCGHKDYTLKNVQNFSPKNAG